jgi:UDP-N-acetylmuramoyl-tripeptide--D-alanyl-D-alanine ligase
MADAAQSATGWKEALDWRIRHIFGDDRMDSWVIRLASHWRPRLAKPVFVGITGSAGKTTTKELLWGVLSHKSRGIANPGTLNVLPEVAKTILRVRPGHAFCIAELTEDRPGVMDEQLALLQPSIGIVTIVESDHEAAYSSADGIALEMQKLVAYLPATGTALLNADDPRVLAMASVCRAKVITFGTSPTADLRAENVNSSWPDRLSMTIVRGTQRVPVTTQLCGVHWLPSVLGAVGAGLATGMTLQECATAVASVAPFEGRMQPITTPDGIHFMRDDLKAPLWTFDTCFDYLRAARARQKFMVIGELSEVGSTKKAIAYRRIAAKAQTAADVTVFVGPWAFSVLSARDAQRPDALQAFATVQDASNFIKAKAQAGDLVFLKGSIKNDHLLRLVLDRTQDIACWRDNCQRMMFCNACSHRMIPSGSSPAPAPADDSINSSTNPQDEKIALGREEQLIVGLGNDDSAFDGTPHNVGFEVVDRLAKLWGLQWQTTPHAWIARGVVKSYPVCLVKLRSEINYTGPLILKVFGDAEFEARRCILVFDDLAVPIGEFRQRITGGAGGHRGVASVLQAFQTNAVRRFKVGIGSPAAALDRVSYVTAPFDAASRTQVEVAIARAEVEILDLLSRCPKKIESTAPDSGKT